jgi:hypothetical protein
LPTADLGAPAHWLIILNDPFFSRAAASEGSMAVSTVQARGWFVSDEVATGVPPVVECFSRVCVDALNFIYPLETTRCFI